MAADNGHGRSARSGTASVWWALLPSAVLVLTGLAVFLPVPGDWSEGFGTAQWYARVFAAAAAALLLLHLGSPSGARAAGLCAAIGTVFGFLEYVDDEASGRAPAPLAACLCCLAAALLCLALLRRRSPWLRFDGPRSALRRRVRLLGAMLVVGVAAGGLVGAGALKLAYELRTEYGPEPPRTESGTVPDDRRDDGAHEGREAWPQALGRQAWQGDFDSPAGLGVCANGEIMNAPEQRFRGTLVAVDGAGAGSAVVGWDAATGAPRWRFTVHDPSGVERVAVSEGCAVMVIHGGWLSVIDAYDGSVRGRSQLPGLRMHSERALWRFITRTLDEGDPPRLVTVPEAELTYLSSPEFGVVAVDHESGGLVAGSDTRGSGCRYLVDHSSPRDTGKLVIGNCAEGKLSVIDLATPGFLGADGSRPLYTRSEVTVPPPLGCEAFSPDSRLGVDVEAASMLTATGTCGADRLWVGHVELRYGRREPVVWTELPGVGARVRVRPVAGLDRSSLLPAPDGITVVERDGDALRHGTLRLGKGEIAEVIEVDSAHPGAHESQLLVQTTSGRIHFLYQNYEEGADGLHRKGSSDAAREPCAGTRDLLVDRASGTVLATCTTAGGGTRVTALRD
ncbi:PQQ-binding-like beta-propeller repeat protein [Streptomyces sp. YC504]|uniref:PQQ-binding-like beta-propeller repeat protein n=1 Tax=Streptomyces mesophilus TaxID=1775132 RepID=A0A6G4XSW5_9ACTN|nr:PQQ-binding-like beta-propeller repeat protein [Streptomyces mesophilus]NGO80689.1 PQQ-binding-like beta-propeller repeat protein [Streptomyces mesophilus]